MNAVNKLIVPLGVTITSLIIPTVAQAQFFNASGRSGYYQESFLLSVEPTGIEDNHIAKFLTANNRGERLTREFVVNCNDTMPQILDEDNVNRSIDIRNDPSSADQTIWELWFAACKKDFAKISKRPERNSRFYALNGSAPVDLNGITYKVHLESLDYSKSLQNLVEAHITREGKKNATTTVFVYCEVDSATVSWPKKKTVVGIETTLAEELNSKVDAETISMSKGVWRFACGPELTSDLDEINSGVPPTDKDGPENAISEIYQSYILVKELCQYHMAPERQLNPIREKLKKLDKTASSQSLDTNAIWERANKKVSKDNTYQMVQLLKLAPIDFETRIKITTTCEQVSGSVSMQIDGYMSKYAGEKTTAKKDF